MGKLYYTSDIKTILDNKVHEILDELLDDDETTFEMDADILGRVRWLRVVFGEVISDMEFKDRKYEEDLLEYSIKKEEKDGPTT